MNTIYDKTGREIKLWDVLKVFHFTGRRRKRYYMYKQVIERVDTQRGVSFYRVSHLQKPTNEPYLLRLDGKVHEDHEIVQGYDGFQSFDDRPRIQSRSSVTVADSAEHTNKGYTIERN